MLVLGARRHGVCVGLVLFRSKISHTESFISVLENVRPTRFVEHQSYRNILEELKRTQFGRFWPDICWDGKEKREKTNIAALLKYYFFPCQHEKIWFIVFSQLTLSCVDEVHGLVSLRFSQGLRGRNHLICPKMKEYSKAKTLTTFRGVCWLFTTGYIYCKCICIHIRCGYKHTYIYTHMHNINTFEGGAGGGLVTNTTSKKV